MIKNIIAICMVVLLCVSCKANDNIELNISSDDNIDSVIDTVDTVDTTNIIDTTIAETTYIDTTAQEDTTVDTETQEDTDIELIHLDGYDEWVQFFEIDESIISPNGKYELQILGYCSTSTSVGVIISSAALIDTNSNEILMTLDDIDFGTGYIIEWSDDSNFIKIDTVFRGYSWGIYIMDTRTLELLKLPHPDEVLLDNIQDVEAVNLLTNYDYWTPMVSSKFIENNIIQIEGSPFFADNCPDILYDYTYNLETKEIVEFNYEIIKHE